MNEFFLSQQLKWVLTPEVWKLTPGRKLFLKFDFSRLILARFHSGHLFLNWDIFVQNGLSKVESTTLTYFPGRFNTWASEWPIENKLSESVTWLSLKKKIIH